MIEDDEMNSNGNGVFDIRNLRVRVEGKEILKSVNLSIKPGEVHALMGPNGSGKSTLAYTLMGHPRYEVTDGEVLFKGENILHIAPEERAKKGVFLAFQYPVAVPGVTVGTFLRTAIKSLHGNDMPVREFRKLLNEKMALLEMDKSFISRYVNDGFSGGEKKRHEILQMALFSPQVAILDETDSGLDIDALKIVAAGINKLLNENLGVLVITHYQRLLNYIQPDFVHVMAGGKIVRSGQKELALELEEKGYEWIV